MAFDYDLFVIGGGSGGVRAARIAAGEYGAKVALAEEYRMGGTCVIRGCVPKKLMVFAADYGAALHEAPSYGWDVTAGAQDWPRFKLALDSELNRLERAYTNTLNTAGVEILPQRAELEDPHTVRLADGRRVTARHILIATGGRPAIPSALEGKGALTSNEVFLLEKRPETMLIIGGGYIASEFAGAFAGMGSKVVQMYRGSQILRGFDEDLRAHVAREMVGPNLSIECDNDIEFFERLPDGRFHLIDARGRERYFDAVVLATGRRPNIEGLGLERAGVKLSGKGAIAVDAYSQTNIPSIFAVGDVTDRVQLTPVAIREGHAFADTVFGGTPVKVDHSLIPTAVFTRPEIGTIGLTEAEARARGEVEIYRTAFRPMQTLFAGSDARSLMKLVVDKSSRKVLGVHLACPGAGEMIQLVAIAIGMGATKEDFDRTMAVHPTLAEELVTMRKPVAAS